MQEDPKIYTSFHDIPPREYMYFPKGQIDYGKPGKFSRTEIIHLIISMSILTVAFAFAITPGVSAIEGFRNLAVLPFGLMMSFFGVVTAFIFHEMSHKFMAQKYGLWSEYRMFVNGLAFALFLGVFVGFVFAAPGAVMFRGESRKFETGRIAMAGPLANMIISAITLPLFLYVFYDAGIIGSIIGFICFINAILATFNLLPFGPLDGVKILRWNVNIWIFMLIISAILTILIFPHTSQMFAIFQKNLF